jgi:predicted membrane protein
VLIIAGGILLAVIGYYGIAFLLVVLLGPVKPVKQPQKMRPTSLPRTGPGPLYR